MTQLAGLLIGVLSLAAGQSDTTSELPHFELDPVVVTAEGLEAELPAVTAASVVITHEEIEAKGLTHVGQVLRELAGVEVLRGGSRGKATTARMRGAGANQTLVMIDGAKLNSPTLGSADLADLSVDNIERIEVVRGSLSALYGSEAIGGVIQIVTKKGRGRPSLWASVEGGGLGTVWGRFAASGSAGATSWSVGASRLESDGQDFDAPFGPLEHDGYGLSTLSGRVDATLDNGERHTLSTRFRWSEGDRDLPIETFGAQVFDRNATQADRGLTFSADWSASLGRWRSVVGAAITDGRTDFRDPKDPDEEGFFAADLDSVTKTERQAVSWTNTVELHPVDTLVMAAEWERRAGRNSDNFSGVNFDEAFENRSLQASNRLVLDGSRLGPGRSLVLSAGLRYDDDSSFGSEWSPRLGALLNLASDRLRLRFNYAEGFRAPAINELSFPFFGNPDLLPETSRSVELGVGGRFDGGRADVELRAFRTHYADLIVADPVTFMAMNLDEADVDGIEAEARWLPSDGLYLRAAYTWKDARDAKGDELLRHPRHSGAVSLAYEADRWRLSGRVLFQGSLLDVPLEGFDERVDAWQRLDIAGAFRVNASGLVTLQGTVENLLDQEYQELKGFPAPGIEARVGVRVGF